MSVKSIATNNAHHPLGTNPELQSQIDHASHLLPTQGPITVFVHHNTLHALEETLFADAVEQGVGLFECEPYLAESTYRKRLSEGRIRHSDLESVLLDEMGEHADVLVSAFGTRYALRLAMLQFPLYSPSRASLRWTIAETDALQRFRAETPAAIRNQMIADTRDWVQGRNVASFPPAVQRVLERNGAQQLKAGDERAWEAVTLQLLWSMCMEGVRQASRNGDLPQPDRRTRARTLVRHRDLLLAAGTQDSDLLVHDLLIRFTASFVDQGFAGWQLPDGEGFFKAFLKIYGQRYSTPATWMKGMVAELQRLASSQTTAADSIEDSLSQLGVSAQERQAFIQETLLALRGWAGMIWQLETNAPWTPKPAEQGTLTEFLAVRLILERYAIAYVARQDLGFERPLCELKHWLSEGNSASRPSDEERAYTLFQLAQVCRWRPRELSSVNAEQWRSILAEVEAFSSIKRRRVYHFAYERKYCHQSLDAVCAHTKRQHEQPHTAARSTPPAYQVACCIDDREESFRRALEEIDPACETYGIAGFYGVAMYYQGLTEAHFRPLCPVNIVPQHYVREEPLYSRISHSRRQEGSRRTLGQATHRVHLGSRTFLGGLVTGLLGSLATFPLVARVAFPLTTAQIRQWISRIVQPSFSELHLERTEPQPGPDHGHLGYSLDEMTSIVEGGLRAMGIVDRLSPFVLVLGHGSGSLNNPHESAYNCGACSGGRGGPNARAFAQMANDHRVRARLLENGVQIPEDTVFLGGYHNTCDDSVTYFDLDRVPFSHRALFERIRNNIDEARQRDAHERCRRFQSADLDISTAAALRHVQARAEDLSQARPEYNHATNSLCFVGRREWSRGLFLDRRAFLTSYDPSQDDESGSILQKLLQAVIPVCAGISLEYYFSTVDPEGYGCGSKLPHNITSLLGVMSGAASDLRPGLSAQMVEIHEPMRILFVIESTPETLSKIIDANPPIERLVKGGWVQVATLHPETSTIHLFRHGEFVRYEPESLNLPTVESSIEWYRGHREHLGFATILPHNSSS